MSRWLKTVPLALALAALSLITTNCNSSSTQAQVRFVHAIQDANALDIDVNGTQEFNGISFLGVLPNQPGYSSVTSGTNTIQGFLTGSKTSQVFSNSAGFGSGTQYTVIATGFSQTGVNGSNVLLLSITDNNTAPASGDVSFRVLLPAYILSEMKAGFQIGAVLFLPFLVVDMVVASITTSVGMMQLPPVVISTPLKLLLFLMVDGWHLLIGALMRSFS